MSTTPTQAPADSWFPQPTGQPNVDFALRTAFENLYTLRDQLGSVQNAIPSAAASIPASGGLFLYGTRQQRQNHMLYPAYNPVSLTLGTPFYETDSGLTYLIEPDTTVSGNPNQWFFLTGIYQLAASSPGPPLPAVGQPPTGSRALTVYDKGYVVFATTVGHSWLWTGTAWTFANGGEGAGGCVYAPVSPNPAIWWKQVPIAGSAMAISAANGGTVNFTYPAYTPPAGWFLWARL